MSNTLETLLHMQAKFRDARPGFDPASDTAIERAAWNILADQSPQADKARFWADETLKYALGRKLSEFELWSCRGAIAEAIEPYETQNA